MAQIAKEQLTKTIFFIFAILLFVSIFISSISRNLSSISIIISHIAILFGFLYLYKKKVSIKFPDNFGLIFLFDLILFIYPFLIADKLNPLYYALTFEVSIFYWLLFYNLKSGSKIISFNLTWLAIVASILYLFNFPSLFFIELYSNKHFHIADLWSFLILTVLTDNFTSLKLKSFFLTITGFVFLVLSNARSSYISLMSGAIYIFNKLKSKDRNITLITFSIITLTCILFIASSLNKSILFSRPYFLQSIKSFVKYPLGVGMGNFEKVSLEYFSSSNNKLIFSYYTHNIYLEALSGVGVFSILFLIFIVKSTIEVLKDNKRNYIWAAVFLSITINFMTDSTYTIPGIIWIWFMVYGTFQRSA